MINCFLCLCNYKKYESIRLKNTIFKNKSKIKMKMSKKMILLLMWLKSMKMKRLFISILCRTWVRKLTWRLFRSFGNSMYLLLNKNKYIWLMITKYNCSSDVIKRKLLSNYLTLMIKMKQNKLLFNELNKNAIWKSLAIT